MNQTNGHREQESALDVARDINEADSIEESLAELEDTPVQRVSSPLAAWIKLDQHRSQVSYQLRMARDTGQDEHAKQLREQREQLLKSQVQVFRDLLEALASEPDVRNTPENWANMPVNLRPVLQKHLKDRGIDVAGVLDQARQIEHAKQQKEKA